jgi:prepilin-type N-terminal cleavage/methylation domain-containing protein
MAIIPHSAKITPSFFPPPSRGMVQGGGGFTNYNPKSNGFTLFEIIIVIVIIGIISTIAAMIIMQGVRAYSDEQSRSDVHYQTRLAMERMAREIRMARQQSEIGTAVLGTIAGNPTNSFIFTDITGATITYSLTGTTLNRTVGGIPSLLAYDVTPLEFRHYNNVNALTTSAASVWYIDITMTSTQGVESLQMRTRVHPRNFK